MAGSSAEVRRTRSDARRASTAVRTDKVGVSASGMTTIREFAPSSNPIDLNGARECRARRVRVRLPALSRPWPAGELLGVGVAKCLKP